MDFITGGSGFLGRHLREALGKVVCIPHDRIASSNPKECDNFYFLSTYGNIASHTSASSGNSLAMRQFAIKAAADSIILQSIIANPVASLSS